MGAEVFELDNISVRFYMAEVVRNINLTIRRGKICSIVGENAAGKSTVMKVLAGAVTNYTGKVFVDGNAVKITSSADARRYGIHMLFHEPLLFEDFSVEYNIFAGGELHTKGFLRKAEQRQKAQELLDYLEYGFNADTIVSELTQHQKRLVEIARAMMSGAELLIFDEITSQYNEHETRDLLRIIGKIKDRLAIVYISHRLEDVLDISDVIVIMRDGEIIERIENRQGINPDDLFETMAGNDYINRYPRVKAKKSGVILSAHRLTNATKTVDDASLNVRRGEIVGIAGFHDSGKTDLIKMIAGIDLIKSGRIVLNGEEVKMSTPHQAIKSGIMYLSEENAENIHLLMDASYNITLANLKKAEWMFLIRPRSIIAAAKYYLKRMNIKLSNQSMASKYHSRGTQQKIALSKLLYADVQVLVINEPTTSLDSASKVEFYNIINRLAHKGKSILFSSSNLPELLGMCDRIYVVREGRIVGELNTGEASSKTILKYAAGKEIG